MAQCECAHRPKIGPEAVWPPRPSRTISQSPQSLIASWFVAGASAGDHEADCTISLTAEVLKKLRDGELNPMMAVMGGQIKISGDMGLAMKVQSLMG